MKQSLLAAVALLLATWFPAACTQSGTPASKPAPLLAPDEPPRVLVFGGTGRLGSLVASALVESGAEVTVFARPESNRRRLDGVSVSFVVGDVLNADQVAAGVAAARPNVIVDALGRGSAGPEFYVDSARHIAAAAATSQVDQVILHGSVGAGDSRRAFNNVSGGMGRLFDAKTQGERWVMDSGRPYTIIRNARLQRFGAGPSGRAQLSTDQTTTASVSRADLAQLTVECLLAERCMNQIFHAVQGEKRP